jgi:4'-phosphopantetheinyl transferase
LLSREESDRAARFVVQQDRQRYVICRAALRIVLGSYLGEAPAAVELGSSRSGKPILRGSIADLRFNVSHSANCLVIAVACSREVGVDAERLTDSVGRQFVLQEVFTPAEVDELLRLSARDRGAGFLRSWTRKEAYVKAVGDGLSVPFDSFEVTVSRQRGPRLRLVDGDPRETERWIVSDVSLGPEYVCALVVEASSRSEERSIPTVVKGEILVAKGESTERRR